MVGRLVEKEQIGVGQQDFAESDACFLTAGQVSEGHIKYILRKSEPCQHASDLGFVMGAVQCHEAFLKCRLPGYQRIHVAVSAIQIALDSGKLFFDGGYLRKDGQDFFHHRPGTVGNGMLFQIADLCLPAFGQIAAVVLHLSRDDFEQGGFARPVDTDKPDFIFIIYVERHVFKQRFAGKRFIDIRSVEQQHL